MTDTSMAAKGLDGIVVGETGLSLVDGENGKLIYCGYDIDELVNCSFEKICYLFLYGEIPNKEGEQKLSEELAKRYKIAPKILSFISEEALKEHPMAVLRTAISMLSGYRSEPDNKNLNELRDCALDLIAKVSTIVSAIAMVRKKKPIVEPNPEFSYSKNFLYMLKGEKPKDMELKTMDTALILHMDHGFNASTFTARVVASSLSDMISAITAAIGSLKGPLHGGANTAVMKMLKEIGSIENVDGWIEKALSEKRKIMGFGHRVYKVHDPRAIHLKRLSKEWGEMAGENKWFKMSEKIEKLMMEKKHINANVDFYSASTYYSMGIEPDIYTPIFAVARMVGWCAHVIEQLKDNRIMRPDVIYTGVTNKKL